MARVAKKTGWQSRSGGCYLVKLRAVELGAKCECKSESPMAPSGHWVVAEADDSAHYVFDPGTQLQKDIWLQSPSDHDERIKALRWRCFACGTVQTP